MPKEQRLGVRHFALLFDSIPYVADRVEQAREQVAATYHVLNTLWPDGQAGLLLCPTEYCGEQTRPNMAALPYLRALGEDLYIGVEVLWTAPQVVSFRACWRPMGATPLSTDLKQPVGQRFYLAPCQLFILEGAGL